MKILVISGTHGNESHAVDVVSQLAYEVKRGEIKIHDAEWQSVEIDFIQAWNKTGLNHNEREFYEEETDIPNDLNRAFLSEKPIIKDDIVKKMKEKIKKYDIIIDVHNSPACMNNILINNNKKARDYVKFCKENNLQYVIYESNTNTIKKYALNMDKVGITVEIGDMGLSDKDYDILFLRKLIKSNFEGLINCVSKPCFSFNEVYQSLYSHTEGILRDNCGNQLLKEEIFRRYDKGDIIFTIIDPEKYLILEKIVAPCDGWLIDMADTCWASKGGLIGGFQPKVEDEDEK